MSVFSMLISYLELNFDVLHAATNNKCADNNDVRLVNLGASALFSKYHLTTSLGKHPQKIEHGHIACSMWKLLFTARECDDLSIGFGRIRDRRQRELTSYKTIKGKYNVRIYLKDIFRFADYQLKGTYGLGCILTLTRKNDSAVLNKDNAINNAKIKINSIHWYVPRYTPGITQENIILNQIVKKMALELHYLEWSFFLKQVNK